MAFRTSADLVHWSERGIAYRDFREGSFYGPTESPFVVRRGERYYLLIGPRPYDPPSEALPNWQHPGYDGTDVFSSARWDLWTNADFIGSIPAHAAEIVQDPDGRCYASSAGVERGGLYLTRLRWRDGLGSRRPGDTNGDRKLDLSDAIWLLGHLFLGTQPKLPCEGGTASNPGPGDRALADFNGDGKIDISDPVGLLGFLFLGARPPDLGTDCIPIPGCPDLCGS